MRHREPYRMKFDPYTIKHLGLQMYSTLPSVIGELVANAWDANATKVRITVPEKRIDEGKSAIIIEDNGIGMSDEDARKKYFYVGRDRRQAERTDATPSPFRRKVMGRKGIGKFAAFGIAGEMEVESAQQSEICRFRMNYDELLGKETEREIAFPALNSTGQVSQGTRITLRRIRKFRNRAIAIQPLRRQLARRFTVIGNKDRFEVTINGESISPIDRDLRRLLDKDADGAPYLWEYENEEIELGTEWTVSGWIGALERTDTNLIDRGIALIARGKLVQEPFWFDASVGQQYALSYLIGELHVEFVDAEEDTIGTSRNSLVWETEANAALKRWGQTQINKIARAWAERRRADNERRLEDNQLYGQFRQQAEDLGRGRALVLADKLVRQTIKNNPDAGVEGIQPMIQTALDFLQFDAFWEIVQDVTQAKVEDTGKLIALFREWQIVEAKELARVTEGRISTIAKFQALIDQDALEVPTLHAFLKEFPWVIDPRWTLIDDEVHYSDLLREKFPESDDVPENDRRIDFLCVRDPRNLVAVEIKRPSYRASIRDLNQIEDYVSFLRDQIQRTSDPDTRYASVVGYLMCGNTVDNYRMREKTKNLASVQIYVRMYRELLSQVKSMHSEFLQRYEQLQKAKRKPRRQ